MGTDNNRKFYQIPYAKLIKKLRNKFGEDRIIEIREQYTSVTDSLAKEEICYHKNYMGKRIKRGLFSSSTGKLINADLNGAINIMRRYYTHHLKIGDMENIIGINLFNPKVLRLAYENS